MAKRRASGEGNIRKRSDGRWEGRYVAGHNPETGKSKLTGDVDFESVKEVASAITPVPGGVGPMTIAMLMRNAVAASEYFHKQNKK